MTRRGLGSVYATRGALGRWFIFAVVFFVIFYVFLATLPLRPDSPANRLFPTNGPLTVAHFVSLTPALLVVSLSNGFEEEFLTRGLFLQKYETFFSARASNVLQAVVFSTAHVGVTYTPTILVFLVIVFLLGLFAGYLMRTTNRSRQSLLSFDYAQRHVGRRPRDRPFSAHVQDIPGCCQRFESSWSSDSPLES
jgi:membrane protease YdiL (CAAX protease family)